MSLPILVLDFDGVLHSYASGWKGAREIPDPPVPGALEFLVRALDSFDVAVLSSRSHQWGGRRAMKAWVRYHLTEMGRRATEDTPQWWLRRIGRTAFADPWNDEVAYAAHLVVRQIKWPLFKPPAMVSIDDRALTFDGTWPLPRDLLSFRPWNKR